MALLARLGLRCGEVAALQFADIDGAPGTSWCAVRGAAGTGFRCQPRWVRRWWPTWPAAGPACAGAVFVTVNAPHRALLACSVTAVVYRACDRAGLGPGGHRLRHALATEMLRQGGALMEIAQVLRHTDLAATAGLCEGGPGRPAHGRCTVAGSGPVSGYAQQAQEYLRLRNALGHKLARSAPAAARLRRLPGSDRRPGDHHRGRPGLGAASRMPAREPRSGPGGWRWPGGLPGTCPASTRPPRCSRPAWPPSGTLAAAVHSTPPADVQALMAEVPRLVPTPLRAATFQTMIGLLAATGMRYRRGPGPRPRGHRLGRGRDHGQGRQVRQVQGGTPGPDRGRCPGPLRRPARPGTARTGKPGFLPVRPRHRGQLQRLQSRFRKLLARTGVGAGAPARPRVHDLRHSFAVHTLARWYRAGEDVAALLPRLSTYLGHLVPGYTYRYLSATPELLELAAARLERPKGARR